jgi:hypothetical protein
MKEPDQRLKVICSIIFFFHLTHDDKSYVIYAFIPRLEMYPALFCIHPWCVSKCGSGFKPLHLPHCLSMFMCPMYGVVLLFGSAMIGYDQPLVIQGDG